MCADITCWIGKQILYNSMFGNVVDCIYPIELQLMDTTDAARSASYLDIHLIRDLFPDVLTRMAAHWASINGYHRSS